MFFKYWICHFSQNGWNYFQIHPFNWKWLQNYHKWSIAIVLYDHQRNHVYLCKQQQMVQKIIRDQLQNVWSIIRKELYLYVKSKNRIGNINLCMRPHTLAQNMLLKLNWQSSQCNFAVHSVKTRLSKLNLAKKITYIEILYILTLLNNRFYFENFNSFLKKHFHTWIYCLK